MVVQVALLVCLLSTVSAVSLEEQFNEWMVEYDKQYSEQEIQIRMKIFSDNLDYINKHNGDPTKTYKSYNIFT